MVPDLNHEDPGNDPGGFHPAVTYVVVIDYDPSDRRKVIFRKTHDTEVATLPDHLLPSEPTPAGAGELLHHVPVKEDCYIQMWLSRNVDWHWQATRAITTAKPLPNVYFKLQYLTSTGWKVQPLPGETTRCIRLGVRHRGAGPVQEDLFNLNVALENPDGSTLPITIDPDIQNPGVR